MDIKPENILVIQFRQLGDVLLSTPAARVLKTNFPSAKLDFLTQPPCHQLLAGNPWINEVIKYDRTRPVSAILDIRARRYDLVVDLMSNPRSALITYFSGAAVKAGPAYTHSAWCYNRKLRLSPGQHKYNAFLKIDLLSQLGLEKIFYPYPEVNPGPADTQWAAAALKTLGLENREFLAISPASRRLTRQWPQKHYARLAAMLAEKIRIPSLIFWGPGEKDLAGAIASGAASPLVLPAPETATLPRLAALLQRSAILVSNCSGTKHIAQASGIPTLGIYGSSDPANWTPPEDPRHQFIRNEALSCLACGEHSCVDGIRCLNELAPEAVFAKLITMFKKAAI
ncbi:MAG: hypothetical protein A2285_06295 [Elusimicrobia bacterium RIFOXYA12_FULL_57_11]|nr:MAG: hypothetical protein A2285_06295 [Elusimicrobia bacterium RIFOXYA12_FULL_57_11]